MEEKIFREKSIERLSTPEDLSDYLKVTNPGIWMVLASVIALLIGVVVWAFLAHLETTLPVKVEVVDNEATVYVTGVDEGKIEIGMEMRTDEAEGKVEEVTVDEYGRYVVKAPLFMDDGRYDGIIVTEKVEPVSFLFDK